MSSHASSHSLKIQAGPKPKCSLSAGTLRTEFGTWGEGPASHKAHRLGYSSRLLHSFEQGELSPPSRSALPRTQEPKGPRAAPSASTAPSSLGAAPSCAA